MGWTRSRESWVVAAAALAALALPACSAEPGSGTSSGGENSGEPIVVRYADYLPENSTYGRMSLAFQKGVTERTDGQVTFENYWAGSLLNQADQLEGVRDGVADMGLIGGNTFPTELPVSSWLLGLGLDLTGSPLHDFAAGSAAVQELITDYEPLREEYASNGLMPLYWTSTVPFMAACTEELDAGPDAYEGRNTRASGVFQSGATKALGGAAVTVDFNEIYEGLQRGVVDCALTDPGSIAAFSFDEVAPNLVPLPVISALGGYAMNLDFWESLPADIQNVMHEEAARASFEFTSIANEDTVLLGELLESGDMRMNDASDLLPTLQTYQEETLDEMAADAPAAVDDPKAVIAEWQERKSHWTDVLVDSGFPLVDTANSEQLMKFFVDADKYDLEQFWKQYSKEAVMPSLPNPEDSGEGNGRG